MEYFIQVVVNDKVNTWKLKGRDGDGEQFKSFNVGDSILNDEI